MSKQEKNMLWIGGAITLLVVIYLLMRKAGIGNTVNNITNNTPGNPSPAQYTVQGMPAQTIWNGGVSGLPTLDLGSDDCGCTSVNGGNFFTSLNDMLNSFNKAASDAFNSYQNNVYQTTPTFIQQYFNNPTGVGQSDTSQAILTNRTGALPATGAQMAAVNNTIGGF